MESNSFIQDYTALAESTMMAITVYLTVLTAYLIAAYSVGSKLTTAQSIFISVLFVMFASVFGWTAWAFMTGAVNFYESRSGLGDGGLQQYIPSIIGFCETAGIIGAISFMLDIRRKNT